MKTPLLISLFLIFGFLGCTKIRHSVDIPLYRKATYSIPERFDPIKTSTTAEHGFANLIYDGLFTVNQYMEIVPVLVESWSLDSKGTTYRFKIKKRVLFHDGSLLTAPDIYQTLMRLKSPESPIRSRYDRIEDIKIGSDSELIVKLKAPYPPFIALLAAPMAKVAKFGSGFNYPIGTGPFKFINKRIEQGQNVAVLERFIGYHSRAPHIERLELWEVNEHSAVQLAKKGFLHDTALIATLPSALMELKDAAIQKITPAAITWVIGINTSKAPLNNLTIRRCLRDSIPAAEFVKLFVPDHLPANGGFLPPTLNGAGNVKLGAPTKALECSSVHGLTLNMDYPEWLIKGRQMCQFFGEAFGKRGVTLKCRALPLDEVIRKIANKTAELSFVSQTLDLPDVEYFLETFESTVEPNLSNYRSHSFDRDLHLARSEQDAKKRAIIYSRLDQELFDRAVVINLSYPPLVSYWHRCLRGIQINLTGEGYIDYSAMSLAVDCPSRADFGLK